jgi:hypothetical protein
MRREPERELMSNANPMMTLSPMEVSQIWGLGSK